MVVFLNNNGAAYISGKSFTFGKMLSKMLQKGKVLGLFILLAISACKSIERPVSTTASATAEPSEIQVLATIHKFHLTNPNYPYSKVTQLNKQFNPDIIAI